MSVLTAWLVDPRDGRGVHFARDDGTWEFRSYPEIASGARRVGSELARSGVRRGDVVCVLMPTGFDFLTAFFGTWAAGATPCLIAPPSFQPTPNYLAHAVAVLRAAQPALVVASAEYAPLIGEAMAAAGRGDVPWLFRAGVEEIEPQPPGGIALLQFTSGSTGNPRGVCTSWENLRANIDMILDLARWRDGDATASWLPLHHDMGMVGCLLCTVTAQGDLWLMQPEQFIRRPMQWLSCFEPGKACHTAAPAFAFSYLSRRVPQERLVGLDLSNWRTALVGAEAIDPAALASFARAAASAGFSSSVYRPSYGLAEATLAVTIADGPPAGTVVRADMSSLRLGEAVRITGTASRGGELSAVQDGWLIGHGRPAADHGVGVMIVDENGRALPDGYLGEIVVTGPSVAAGYYGAGAGGLGSVGTESTRFADGELRTGDAGFFHGPDLFVLGRMGDSLKVNGRSFYVEELEARVSAATSLERSRLAVVNAYDAGTGVALFAEATPHRDWITAAHEALRCQLGPDFPVTVVAGGRGLIKRTSSGKPRRRHMWQLLHSGDLSRATVLTSAGPEEGQR